MVEKLRRSLLSVAAILAVLTPLAAVLFASTPAQAAGEKWEFNCANTNSASCTIDASGGSIEGKWTLRPSNGAATAYSGAIKLNNNPSCQFNITIVDVPDPVSGKPKTGDKVHLVPPEDPGCRPLPNVAGLGQRITYNNHTYFELTLTVFDPIKPDPLPEGKVCPAGMQWDGLLKKCYSDPTGPDKKTCPPGSVYQAPDPRMGVQAKCYADPVDASSQASAQCEAGAALNWIICDMIIGPMLSFIDWTRDNVIIPFLQEKPLTTDNVAFPIWKAVNNVANVGLIIIFFLVIFGTALGFDNYTIKKMLPRLIMASILIQISWYISAAIIDLGNILGQGLVAIIDPLIGAPPKIDFTQAGIGGQGVLLGTAALGVGGAIGVIGIGLATIVTLMLSLLVFFFTLIFRKVLILLLAVFSGFGYLLWVLPNTQRMGGQVIELQFRLALMYPLTIMFILGGKMFAKVAEGAYGAGTGAIQSTLAHYLPNTGHGAFHLANVLPFHFADAADLLVPYAQLGGYAMTFLAAGLSFMIAGKALNGVRKGLRQSADYVNGKYGKGSDFDRSRAENRQRNNLIRQRRAQERGGIRGRVMSGFYGVRSGAPGGFAGVGRRVRAQQRLKREKAYQEAAEEQGAIEGHDQSRRQLPRESAQARVAAARQSAVNKAADAQGQRAGFLDAQHATGNPPANERYNAERTLAARKEAEHIGQHQAVNAVHGSPQALGDVATAARRREEISQVEARGAVEGVMRAAANARVDLDTMQLAAAGAARKEMLDKRGEAYGKAEIAAVRPETNDELVQAAYLKARGESAKGKAQRLASVEMERTDPLSGARIFEAATNDAQKTAATERADQRASLRESTLRRATGEGTRELLEAADETAQDRRAEEMGARRATRTVGRERQTRIAAGGTGTFADQVTAAQITKEDQLLNEIGTEEETIRNRQAAVAAGLTRQKMIDAAAASTKEDLDKRAGMRLGSLDAVAQQNTSAEDINASRKQTEQEKTKAAGERQGVNEGHAVNPISGGEVKQAAARAKATSISEENQKYAGLNLGNAEEEKRLMDENPGMTRPQARAQMLQNAGQASSNAARLSARDTAGKAEGGAASMEGLIDNRIAAEKRKTGRTLTRDEAAKAIGNEYSAAAARDSYNSVIGQGAKVRGIANARAQYRKALIDEAAEQGNVMTDAEAAAIIENAADATIAEQSQRAVTESTGQEVGTMRGIEANVQRRADQLVAEAAAAGRTLTPEQARTQATGERAKTNVRDAAAKTDVKFAEQDAQERANVEARGEAIGREQRTLQQADTFANDVTLEDGSVIPAGETVPKGAVLAPGTPMPAHSTATGAQAQNRLLANAAQKAGTTAGLKAAETYGQNIGTVQTEDAAIDREMYTMQRDDKLGYDVTTADGSTIRAGNTIPKGTVLAKGTAMPTHSAVNREQARVRILRNAMTGGVESGIRQEAAEQAKIGALSQAAARGTASAEARIGAHTQAELDRLASETANIEAARIATPGQPMHREYEAAVADAQRVAENQLLDKRVTEAGRAKLPELDNIPIESVPRDPEYLEKLADVTIGRMKDQDTPTAIAAGKQMTGSNGGQDRLVREVQFKPVSEGGFGGDWFSSVDLMKAEELKPVWDKTVVNAKNADLKKPTTAAVNSLSAEDFNASSNQITRFMDMFGGGTVTDPVTKKKVPVANAEEVATNKVAEMTALASAAAARAAAATTPEERDLALAEQKKAEEVRDTYQGHLKRRDWEKQSQRFADEAVKTLQANAANPGQTPVESKTKLALGKRAEQQLAAIKAKPPQPHWMTQKQAEDIIKVMDTTTPNWRTMS